MSIFNNKQNRIGQGTPTPGSSYAAQLASQPQGTRILAQGEEVSNNTWETGLNNNDLIIGSTGAGKTRNYVKPNLMQMNESFVVSDTKGSLIKEVGPLLKANGYRVLHIDFTDMMHSFGYNPFDFIRTNSETGGVCEQDVIKITDALCPVENHLDPFWDYATRNLLGCLIAFVCEGMSKRDRTPSTLIKLITGLKMTPSKGAEQGITDAMLDRFSEQNPKSLAATRWSMVKTSFAADKMNASILGILAEKMEAFSFDGITAMFNAPERIDFKDLGLQKTALFLTVSDTDRSVDQVIGLLYTQALQTLCDFADDECPGHALPVPVRLILDDFATNYRINNFDKIISVIRSRNIAVSIVLQSITQLETLYSHAAAITILNGCDHFLYLGGQDLGTINYVAAKAGKMPDTILAQNLDEVWLFARGTGAKKVQRYDITQHDMYEQLPEAHAKLQNDVLSFGPES